MKVNHSKVMVVEPAAQVVADRVPYQEFRQALLAFDPSLRELPRAELKNLARAVSLVYRNSWVNEAQTKAWSFKFSLMEQAPREQVRHWNALVGQYEARFPKLAELRLKYDGFATNTPGVRSKELAEQRLLGDVQRFSPWPPGFVPWENQK